MLNLLAIRTHFIPSVRKSAVTFLQLCDKNLLKTKNQPYYKVAEIQLYLIKRKIPWMRFERMTYRLEGGCSIQLSYQGLDPEGLDKRLVFGVPV